MRPSRAKPPKEDNRTIHLSLDHLPKEILSLLCISANDTMAGGTIQINRDSATPMQLAILCTVLSSEFIIESQPTEVIEIYNSLNPTLRDVAITPKVGSRLERTVSDNLYKPKLNRLGKFIN